MAFNFRTDVAGLPFLHEAHAIEQTQALCADADFEAWVGQIHTAEILRQDSAHARSCSGCLHLWQFWLL